MSHWTIMKDGKEYSIPREIEVLDPVERGAAVTALITATDAKHQEADRLFGAAPIKGQE